MGGGDFNTETAGISSGFCSLLAPVDVHSDVFGILGNFDIVSDGLSMPVTFLTFELLANSELANTLGVTLGGLDKTQMSTECETFMYT